MIPKYPKGKDGPLFVVDISDLITKEGLEKKNLRDTADKIAFRVSQIMQPIEIPDHAIEELQNCIWKMDSEAVPGNVVGFCRELAVLYSWGKMYHVDFGPTYEDPMASSYGWPPVEELDGMSREEFFDDFVKEVIFEFETFEPELDFTRMTFSMTPETFEIEARTLPLSYFKPLFNVAENMGLVGTVFPLDQNTHLGLLIILRPMDGEQ